MSLVSASAREGGGPTDFDYFAEAEKDMGFLVSARYVRDSDNRRQVPIYFRIPELLIP